MELLAAIADRVARDPAAVAFEGPDGKRLDYGGLDARADALAAGLRAHGVGPGRLVALMLPRSTDLFTAELAVQAFGGLTLIPEVAAFGGYSPATLSGADEVSLPVSAVCGVA